MTEQLKCFHRLFGKATVLNDYKTFRGRNWRSSIRKMREFSESGMGNVESSVTELNSRIETVAVTAVRGIDDQVYLGGKRRK